MLDYNTTNFLDLLSDINKKNINSRRLNNSKQKVKLANIMIDINKEDIRSIDIDKQKPIISN